MDFHEVFILDRIMCVYKENHPFERSSLKVEILCTDTSSSTYSFLLNTFIRILILQFWYNVANCFVFFTLG